MTWNLLHHLWAISSATAFRGVVVDNVKATIQCAAAIYVFSMLAVGEAAAQPAAQTPATGTKTKDEILAEITAKLDNPFSDLYLIWIENDYTTYAGDLLDGTKGLNSFKIQPVLPVQLSSKWNLLQRPVLQVQTAPLNKDVGQLFGVGPGAIVTDPSLRAIAMNPWGSTSGLGDLIYVAGLSPVTKSPFVWGAGASFIFPTATTEVLGQGKWQAGPAFLGFYFSKRLTLGAIAQQWWSYAGDSNRADTNQLSLQYFVSLAFPGTTWKLAMSPMAMFRWKALDGNKATFPIGLGANRMLYLGKLPVRVGGEADYAVVGPDLGPRSRWTFKATFTAVIPHGKLMDEIKAAGLK